MAHTKVKGRFVVVHNMISKINGQLVEIGNAFFKVNGQLVSEPIGTPVPVIPDPSDLPEGCSIAPDGSLVFTHSSIISSEFLLKYNCNSVDIFCVGGGGGGGTSNSYQYYAETAGAQGGYTKTEKTVDIQKNKNITITVGAGGKGKTADSNARSFPGSASSVKVESETLCSANGGDTPMENGGHGGSGGGAITSGTLDGHNGGSNGNDGEWINGTTRGSAGYGQHKTTRRFDNDITDETIYAGGGGGGKHGNSTDKIGSGGEGGGGRGSVPAWSDLVGQSGTPNTGGGAGGNFSPVYAGADGGSGVVIIKFWKTNRRPIVEDKIFLMKDGTLQDGIEIAHPNTQWRNGNYVEGTGLVANGAYYFTSFNVNPQECITNGYTRMWIKFTNTADGQIQFGIGNNFNTDTTAETRVSPYYNNTRNANTHIAGFVLNSVATIQDTYRLMTMQGVAGTITDIWLEKTPIS